MAIVARMRVRFGASLLAVLVAVVTGCDATPSAIPASPGATAAAVASAPPGCQATAIDPPAGPTPVWQGRTWYEAFVRSFADSNADGVGDLKGLTAELDYLNDGDPSTANDLGVGGIWLMPVAKAASYHGYDVTDYTAIEPDYGTDADFRAFITAAHQRGIEVIVDFVINHTSIDHPWFQDALEGGPHRDWYIWSATDPGWPAVAGPNPWHRTQAGDYYYGAFWEGMPDLNLRNPAVTAEIKRIAGVWLDDFGVDGFRIDAAKHLIEDDGAHQVNTPETLAWLADFTTTVHATHPDALVLGEVYGIAKTAGTYVPSSLDSTFDFGLASAVVSALQQGRTPPITTALSETLEAWPSDHEASFLTNHDQERVMSQLSGDLPSAHLAALLLLSAPGVPFVYYGEEIGMQGRKPDEQIRTPMQWSADSPAGGFSTAAPWEPLADDWATTNVAAETGDASSLLSTYRHAITLRQAHTALSIGATVPIDGGATPVIGWLRIADETLLTIVNVSVKPVTDYGLKLAAGSLCGVTGGRILWSVGDPGTVAIAAPAVTSTGGLDGYQPLPVLPPRSGYVIRLDWAQ